MAARRPVLIVEDNPETRDVIQRVLEISGYEAAAATDGLEAIDFLRAATDDALPEVILLDLRMPNMDGWTFLEALRREPRFTDIQVIIFSADPDTHTVPGVLGWIRKGSTDPDVLLALLRQAYGEKPGK